MPKTSTVNVADKTRPLIKRILKSQISIARKHFVCTFPCDIFELCIDFLIRENTDLGSTPWKTT
jgi:hypothetical protein